MASYGGFRGGSFGNVADSFFKGMEMRMKMDKYRQEQEEIETTKSLNSIGNLQMLWEEHLSDQPEGVTKYEATNTFVQRYPQLVNTFNTAMQEAGYHQYVAQGSQNGGMDPQIGAHPVVDTKSGKGGIHLIGFSPEDKKTVPVTEGWTDPDTGKKYPGRSSHPKAPVGRYHMGDMLGRAYSYISTMSGRPSPYSRLRVVGEMSGLRVGAARPAPPGQTPPVNAPPPAQGQPPSSGDPANPPPSAGGGATIVGGNVATAGGFADVQEPMPNVQGAAVTTTSTPTQREVAAANTFITDIQAQREHNEANPGFIDKVGDALESGWDAVTGLFEGDPTSQLISSDGDILVKQDTRRAFDVSSGITAPTLPEGQYLNKTTGEIVTLSPEEVASLSSKDTGWAAAEIRRLNKARRSLREQGMTAQDENQVEVMDELKDEYHRAGLKMEKIRAARAAGLTKAEYDKQEHERQQAVLTNNIQTRNGTASNADEAEAAIADGTPVTGTAPITNIPQAEAAVKGDPAKDEVVKPAATALVKNVFSAPAADLKGASPKRRLVFAVAAANMGLLGTPDATGNFLANLRTFVMTGKMMPEMKAQFENQKNWALAQKALSDIVSANQKSALTAAKLTGQNLKNTKTAMELLQPKTTGAMADRMKTYEEALKGYFHNLQDGSPSFAVKGIAGIPQDFKFSDKQLGNIAQRAENVYRGTLAGPLAALAIQLKHVDLRDVPHVQLDPTTGQPINVSPHELSDNQAVAILAQSGLTQRWGADMARLYATYVELREGRDWGDMIGTGFTNLPELTFKQFIQGDWRYTAAAGSGVVGFFGESNFTKRYNSINREYGMEREQIGIFLSLLHPGLAADEARVRATGDVIQGQVSAEQAAAEKQARKVLYGQ